MALRLDFGRFFPGVLVASAISVSAVLTEHAQTVAFGRALFDAAPIAILLGSAFRAAAGSRPALTPGVEYLAKPVLEFAIVLMGATISITTLRMATLELALLTIGVVSATFTLTYGAGRLMRLPRDACLLIACGNSICGNSAIVAAAPVIGARPPVVAATIAVTATIGVLLIVLLPFASALAGFGDREYGILAGLTVYAVPQVLAATLNAGAVSAQLAVLIKMFRVSLLAPTLLLLSLASSRAKPKQKQLSGIVPWFLYGFLILMALRALGFIPDQIAAPAKSISTVLTVVAMSALGLSVDVRHLIRSSLGLIVVCGISVGFLVGVGILLTSMA